MPRAPAKLHGRAQHVRKLMHDPAANASSQASGSEPLRQASAEVC